MNIEEMREKREDIIDGCLIQRKTIAKKGKPDELIEKGPCDKVEGKKCMAYMYPASRWRLGNCALASHIIGQEDKTKFVNPIKKSKRKE